MAKAEKNPVKGVPTPGHALFVDDDPGVRRALGRVLRNASFRVSFAASAKEALEVLARNPVQVLVTDLRMPGMDGLALVERVKGIDPRVVCMILSSVITEEVLLASLNSGQVYRYLQKPWDDTELVLAVERALELHRLGEENRRLLVELEEHNHRLEEEVRERIRQLRDVEPSALLGRFAAQLVHNLKNPIQVILGAVEILESGKGKGAEGEPGLYTRMIKEGVLDLADMVEAILEHMGGRKTTPAAAVDVNALVRKQLEFMEMDPFFRYDLRKEVRLQEGLPPVHASPLELQEVLYNLIRNAGDAMEHAPEKCLRVRTALEGGRVFLEVKDTGDGIAPEHLEKIFRPDFTTKPFGKGTGLGLARVKEIVEVRAWKIGVRSTPGKGTTFTVEIPSAAPGALGEVGREQARRPCTAARTNSGESHEPEER